MLPSFGVGEAFVIASVIYVGGIFFLMVAYVVLDTLVGPYDEGDDANSD